MYARRLYFQPMVVFCTIIALPFLQQLNLLNDCKQRETTLTCNGDIPELIPYGVKEVFIKDFKNDSLVKKEYYQDVSWRFVTKLDIISIDADYRWIVNNSFIGLNNLQSLGIHGNVITGIQIKGLTGLDNLVHLDLADCEYLDIANLIPSLTTANTLPNLKSLNLKGVNSHHNSGRLFVLSAPFIDMLQTKSITRLSLSGTNIMLNNVSLLNRTFSLEYLDLSNTTFVKTDRLVRDVNSFQVFKTSIEKINSLNISDISSIFFQTNSDFQNKIIITKECSSTLFLSLLKFKNIYANHIHDKEFCFNNVSLDISSCEIKIKTVHFRGNNMRKVNATVYWPFHIELTEIDLASNNMCYLSPKSLGGVHGLKYLFLQNNNLSHMETFPEFVDLLKTFSQLEHFNMAYNKLTFIPYKMFHNNTQLKFLDLMGNELKSIMFQLNHLVMLQTLDLRQNRILYLEGNALMQLQNLFVKLKTDENYKFDVNLDGNPLICSCESLDFIKWLETDNQPYTHRVYKCTLEGNTNDIDTMAVEKSNYLCKRVGIIAAISFTSFLGIMMVIIIVAIVTHKVRKKKYENGIKSFLDKFKGGRKLKQKYLVLLSHSGDDGDFVQMHVYQQLDNNLRQMVGPGIRNDITCLGDIHFQPGVSLLNEIMRCVEESCVMIFVISRAFCESPFCRMELKEAYQQEKPIILIFKEHVEQAIMPQYLKNIFLRYTRVKLVQINGQYEPQSGWRSVCESVLLLASRTQEQNILEDRV